MTRARLRGIYATALTERLRGEVDVVAPSRAIADRFDGATFGAGPPDVEVADAPDRLGVGVSGEPAGVATVRQHLAAVARDALTWLDDAPRGLVVEAEVTGRLGGGAVVDLGSREGFLPRADGDRAEPGDVVRVQVREPAPPWGDRRPSVATGLEARAGPVTLVRGGEAPRADVADPERADELVRSLELLSADVPDGWAVRFGPSAADAPLSALDDALALAADRAAAVLAAREGDEPPLSTAWVWFGRESRFALDGARRAATPTMPGHHRVKAIGDGASAAVDLVEALRGTAGEPGGADGLPDGPDAFPFAAVADGFGPHVGDELGLSHGKPDGRRFSLGTGVVTEREGETVTLRRELSAGGPYDGLGVPREDGDVAVTRLTEGRWWYPTAYRDAGGELKGTYVNVCTPVEVFPDAATYVDLEVDVVKHADGTVERLDDDELDAAVAAGHLSEPLAGKAREVAASVERALTG